MVHAYICQTGNFNMVKWTTDQRPGESFKYYPTLLPFPGKRIILPTHLDAGRKGTDLGAALSAFQWAPDSQKGTIWMEPRTLERIWAWSEGTGCPYPTLPDSRGPRNPEGYSNKQKQIGPGSLTCVTLVDKLNVPNPSGWLSFCIGDYLIYGLARAHWAQETLLLIVSPWDCHMTVFISVASNCMY